MRDNDRFGNYPVEFPGIQFYEKKGIAAGSIRPGKPGVPANSSEWDDQLRYGSMLPMQLTFPLEAGQFSCMRLRYQVTALN